MNIFDILGPVMVGPSSSHTAGAVRIGYVAQSLLKDKPKRARIILHGSFAATGVGHGTDRALVAGLMGMKPDDGRIPNSFAIAKEKGLEIEFEDRMIAGAHPNTVILEISTEAGESCSIQASSIGGGRIFVDKIDGLEAKFSGEHPTLIVHHRDFPGMISKVTKILAENGTNIGSMQLYRGKRGGTAVMIIEMDAQVEEEVLLQVRKEKDIRKVTYLRGGY
ncbi:MAG TPA: L-serine ammonia-lyase, iron-sulfur-dependent subunit beta [Lachnospiraceae bacterium]